MMPSSLLRPNQVRPTWRAGRILLAWSLAAIFGIARVLAAEKVDFVKEVQPILVARCVRCHGPDKQEGSLRLDYKKGAMRGGDNYQPAIVSGQSSNSPLFQFVSRPDADLKMPPQEELTATEIEILRKWIDEGAAWPDEDAPFEDPAQRHWAFQPLRRPTLPAVRSTRETYDNAIDRLIITKLTEQNLVPSLEADRSTLIRRLYFDLLGLPPAPEEVHEFVRDPNPQAYERLVDRLLAMPQYGERSARLWLDVVRFAESHGFEMNQVRPHAWRYRDYVIRAFNDDKPYDQFVREQIAGDCLGAEEATGFLVGGPWDQVKSPDPVLTSQQRADELHDMVSTLSSTFLGLTVGCGRCHSHKFDPIPQTDYYALKACLEGVQHGDREIQRREEKVAESLVDVERARAELAELENQSATIPVNARLNVERFPAVSAKKVRVTIRATNQGAPCIDELEAWTTDTLPRNVALASAGAKATASGVLPNSDIHRLEHIHDGRYGNSRSWISNEEGKGWVEIAFARPEVIQRIHWGRDREQKYTDRLATDYVIEVYSGDDWKQVASAQVHADSPVRIARRRELEQQLAGANGGMRMYAGKFVQPGPTLRFHRGDPTQPREPIAPGSLTSFGQSFRLPLDTPEQERRAALASWISDPDNRLTARVIANRVWQQHFLEGIVNTPSDLGVNGGRPSHPELLDWLALELISHGWSLKHLQRQMVLSATYRQSSAARPDGLEIDATSRLLWRFPPRRLEAEALRDAILSVSGNLDGRMGGPGFDLFEPNNNYVKVYQSRQTFGPAEWRRMVYQSKPRMQLDNTFGAFDCPDAGQIAPRRTRSTTPLQALNLLNSPFMVQQVEIFAGRLRRDAGEDLSAQARRGWELAFQRSPTNEELAVAVRVVVDAGLTVFCRALLNANEFLYVF